MLQNWYIGAGEKNKLEFQRNIYLDLEKWKSDRDRKPLILRGARQVGKTTLVREFSKEFEYAILLNLEKPNDLSYFETHDDIQTIVQALFLSHNIPTKSAHDTLLFIDEIQESPKTIHLLRYFYEEFPQLHVIAAGSLLEFALSRVEGFPVGRVEFLYLHPLNFIEYLNATGYHDLARELNKIPVAPVAHKLLIDLFHRYTIVGGMPEVIKADVSGKGLADLPRIYESIWGTWENDIEKYTTNDTERKVIRHIISTAHLSIDQRIKFQNFGNSNYRSREVGEALRNLDAAKIIRLIYPTTDLHVPVKPDIKKSPRLQFLDTGLVNYALSIQGEMLGLDDFSKAFKGAIIPHMVTQELISLNFLRDQKPHFWVREKKGASSEVDLVYSYQGMVIPIEVKSGSTGSLKSLHQFMQRTNHPYAVRIYGGEFHIEKIKTPDGTPFTIMHLPYYLGTKIPSYIEYFIENDKMTS